jgi:hypothetical protein
MAWTSYQIFPGCRVSGKFAIDDSQEFPLQGDVGLASTASTLDALTKLCRNEL